MDATATQSPFNTIRLLKHKTLGRLARKTSLAMVFKLLLSAKKSWRRLERSNQIAVDIQGVKFEEGIRQIKYAA